MVLGVTGAVLYDLPVCSVMLPSRDVVSSTSACILKEGRLRCSGSSFSSATSVVLADLIDLASEAMTNRDVDEPSSVLAKYSSCLPSNMIRYRMCYTLFIYIYRSG